MWQPSPLLRQGQLHAQIKVLCAARSRRHILYGLPLVKQSSAQRNSNQSANTPTREQRLSVRVREERAAFFGERVSRFEHYVPGANGRARLGEVWPIRIDSVFLLGFRVSACSSGLLPTIHSNSVLAPRSGAGPSHAGAFCACTPVGGSKQSEPGRGRRLCHPTTRALPRGGGWRARGKRAADNGVVCRSARVH